MILNTLYISVNTEIMLPTGQMFNIRRATNDDRMVIVANINRICAEKVYLASDWFVLTSSWEAGLCNEPVNGLPALVAVVEVSGQVVGHGRVFPAGFGHKDYHVADIGLALLPEYREMRLGTHLLADLVTWAQSVGYEKLTADIFATNQRALRLFARFGFLQEGVRVRQAKIAGRYVDEILVSKFLE